MTIEEIENLIKAGINGANVTMEGDGCSCSTTVISEEFNGKSLLERQKMVLATVRAQIDSGELHALSIKAKTPEEV